MPSVLKKIPHPGGLGETGVSTQQTMQEQAREQGKEKRRQSSTGILGAEPSPSGLRVALKHPLVDSLSLIGLARPAAPETGVLKQRAAGGSGSRSGAP